VFILVGVCAAEGEGVVAVGFRGIVEGSVISDEERDLILRVLLFLVVYERGNEYHVVGRIKWPLGSNERYRCEWGRVNWGINNIDENLRAPSF